MILAPKNTITNVFYVLGIPEMPTGICIEEQITYSHTEDNLVEEYYDYYIFSAWYGTKMYMYGTAEKSMPTEELIKHNFEIYKEDYMQE